MEIILRQIKKTYGGTPVLQIPQWRVEFSHCLALIGPSGGGKSTLLRLLGGLETPEEGTLVVDGIAVPRSGPELLAYRRSIGTVFQAFNLFPHLCAWENVALPLHHVHGFSLRDAREQADSWLQRFGLGAHQEKRPAALSGGQRQRVAIARAVACRPRFLLLDEPTSALDPEMTAEVLELLDELRRDSRPLVLVTHEIGFAHHAADVVAFLECGNIAAHGPAADFFNSPPTESVHRFLRQTLRFSHPPLEVSFST